ncbi:MAG: HEAT repeat domain-containing protein [Firmicutes bacterium]|nr:HEAT repeat domain-containing protein [Bacillota bacterium]
MNIEKLEEAYKHAQASGGDFTEHLKFNKLLLSDNSYEIIDYHYDLLRRRENMDFYYDIRASFTRRPNIEQFLLKKIKDEKDHNMLADILQILGTIKSSYAGKLAREFIQHEQESHREVATFVLGWVGIEEDIPILTHHLLTEKNSKLRITAASAHRQIHFRLPELKNKLLASLKQGFEKETDDEVIQWIIVMIESIALKRLGLREDKQDPDIIHGDLEKAKLKTAKFLAELDLG